MRSPTITKALRAAGYVAAIRVPDLTFRWVNWYLVVRRASAAADLGMMNPTGFLMFAARVPADASLEEVLLDHTAIILGPLAPKTYLESLPEVLRFAFIAAQRFAQHGTDWRRIPA